MVLSTVFLWCLCLEISLSAATVPAGFAESVVAGPGGGSWNEAAGLTFESNGRMYVWERAGRVWFKDVGDSTFSQLLDLSQEVGAWEDLGATGFALDPNFRVNGYIYLLYVVDRHHLLNFGTGSYNPNSNAYYDATIGRLTRYTCRSSDGFRSVDPASRFVLIGATKSTGIPICSYTHGVGSLAFGEDGTLLVSTGDGASPNVPDLGGNRDGSYTLQALSDGILKVKEDVGAFRSQLVDCLNGKILRIDPVTGLGLPSNPFYDAASPGSARSRVWTLGHRNPFRMSLKFGSGSHSPAAGNPGALFVGDVGWNNWESLQVVTGPRLNFGWPLFEGLELVNEYAVNINNLDAPNPLGCSQYFSFRDLLKEDTLNPAGQPPFANPCNSSVLIPSSIPQFLHARPVLDWYHWGAITRTPIYGASGQAAKANVGAAGSPVSGVQFRGNAAAGGIWYTGTSFPAQYQNSFYLVDWGVGEIKRVTFDQNHKPVSVANFLSNGGFITSVAMDPTDGSLYYCTFDYSSSVVRKLTYAGNRTPVAAAAADKYFGPGPLAVQFSSAGSSDPDGQAITYSWNFDDGTPVSTQANPAHTFTAPAGVPTGRTVTLTVTDSGGLSAQVSLKVAVNGTPPAVTIISPTNGLLYPPGLGTNVNLIATVNDLESSDAQLSYQWQTLLQHNEHNHGSPPDTNHVTTAVISPTTCDGISIYYYRILLTVTDPQGLATTREVQLFPNCGPSTPPTITGIANQNIDEDTSTGALNFTVGDAETPAGSLVLTGSSSNPGVVPNGNIVFGGSGANRTVTVSPASNQFGTATITVGVSDGQYNVATNFLVTINAVNDAPTITAIAHQTINVSASTGPLALTIGDVDTAVGSLTVSPASSNPALVPVGNIVLGGSGANRTVTVTPVAGQSGNATITLSVSDGLLSASNSFGLTVSTVVTGTASFTNAAAITIPSVGNATPYPSVINVNGLGGTVSNVTVTLRNLTHTWPADVDALLVSPGGQQLLLMSDAGTGPTGNATVTFSDPATGSLPQWGAIATGTYKPTNFDTTTDIFGAPAPAGPYAGTLATFNGAGGNGAWSLYVIDDGPGDQGSVTGGWSLSITTTGGGPAAPTISDIVDQTTTVNTATAAIPFTVADADTPVGNLTVSGSSLNPTLVPNANLVFGGSGANRTVTVTPAAGQTGSATLTVTVSDGSLTASDPFVLTVNAVSTPPTITGLVDQTIEEDTTTGALTFTVGDAETAAGSLALIKGSSNLTLVPTNNIVFGGSGANRTVTVSPATNQFGTATITIGVSDGQYNVTTNFLVTINAVNDAPTITAIANQTINVSASTGPLAFTIGDVDTAVGSLTVSPASSNPALVPVGNIVLGGSGANRTVTVTPVAGQSGNATITLSVSDGLLSTSNSFGLTVSTVVTGTASFTNAAAITIPSVGNATPYPSVINVNGLGGTVSNVTVRLTGYTHTWSTDVDVLLVSPTGQQLLLMSDAGSGPTANATVTFSDTATGSLPQYGAIATGTYMPTNFDTTTDIFAAPAPAGPYAGTLTTFNGAGGNGAWSLYVIDDGPGDQGSVAGGWSLTITTTGGTQQTPVISWGNPAAITYGTALGGGQLNATASVPGTFAYGPAAGTVLNAGNGQVLSVTFTPNDTANYTTATRTVAIDVVNAPLTITAENKGKVYGAVNPGLTASYAGFVNGDTAASLTTPVSLNTTETTGSPVGPYPITASGATAPNYTITHVNGTLTVAPAPLTITAEDKSRLLSEPNPPLTANYAGWVNGDTVASLDVPVTLTTTATGGSPAGTYPITASAAVDANYTITHVNGTLTVAAQSPPVVTLSAGSLSYIENYGAVLLDPSATVTDSDSANFDTGALTVWFTANGAGEDRLTIRNQGSGPGEIGVAGNQVSYGGAQIGNQAGGTDGATPLVINLNAAATPVAAQALLRNVSYANVSSTPSTLTRTVRVEVADGDGGTSLPATRTISVTGVPETPVITWSNPSAITYGTALSGAQLNATTSVPGAFVYSPVAGTVLNAGNAQSLGVTFTPNDLANYTTATQTVVIDVVNASLTITAENKSRPFEQPNPPLTAAYSGFVNGDTVASLDTAVNLTTAATVSSPAGNYPILASGATDANYTINHINGTLTVTNPPAPGTVGTFAFTNAAAITIPSVGAATPYPSVITVAGLSGTISNMTVTFYGITHARMRDIDILLVGPGGQRVIGLSDVGPNSALNNITLTLSDAAATAMGTGTIVSGTYRPTNITTGDTFAAPAPVGPYGATLAAFTGQSANGGWSLYVVDDLSGSTGSIAGGWSLTLTTMGPQPPTISTISNQSTAVNTATAAIPFTIGDVDTPVGNLTLSGGSSTPTLVPINNIVFGGSGSNRTVTVTPASGQTGNATITLSVSDGQLSASNSFGLTVSTVVAGTASFTNPAAITIPSVGNAAPYPSVINVAGLGGTVSNVTVRVTGYTHTWSTDVDVLLVSPTGQQLLLMSDAGSGPTANATVTFSDTATGSLPQWGPIATGTYKPTNFDTTTDIFAAPAPTGPYAGTLATFNGQVAGGAWSLYVIDDGPGDQGSVAGGWSLTITTSGSGQARLASAGQPPQITAVTIEHRGAVRVTIRGEVGLSYALEASSDFVNWTKVDVQDNVTGSIIFNDQPTNSVRFYRAVSLPK